MKAYGLFRYKATKTSSENPDQWSIRVCPLCDTAASGLSRLKAAFDSSTLQTPKGVRSVEQLKDGTYDVVIVPLRGLTMGNIADLVCNVVFSQIEGTHPDRHTMKVQEEFGISRPGICVIDVNSVSHDVWLDTADGVAMFATDYDEMAYRMLRTPGW